MSVEIVLIPLAIAAVSAWQAKRADDEFGRSVVEVSTRMRDTGLLNQALTDTGGEVRTTSDGLLVTWASGQAKFIRNQDGIWSAHFGDGFHVDEASALVRSVDSAYGVRVQEAVLARIRQRAGSAGMSIESETVEDDKTVTMVLNVVRGQA